MVKAARNREARRFGSLETHSVAGLLAFLLSVELVVFHKRAEANAAVLLKVVRSLWVGHTEDRRSEEVIDGMNKQVVARGCTPEVVHNGRVSGGLKC